MGPSPLTPSSASRGSPAAAAASPGASRNRSATSSTGIPEVGPGEAWERKAATRRASGSGTSDTAGGDSSRSLRTVWMSQHLPD
eukprot:scaffold7273_cov73-Isochrysis_galbana.AAC.1